MITCIIGTRAQLIKMAPVIKELEKHKHDFQILLTGQHKETIDTLLEDFTIKTKPIQLEIQNEISSMRKMFLWFPRTLIKMFNKRKQLFEGKKTSWIIVHGDTLSTLLGAIVGKFTSCKVAHIESGLRSYSFFSPFPEEITRICTFYLADVGFCPGNWAVENLKKYPIESVNTFQNTIIDSVKVAIASNKIINVPNKPYAVVSIHRFENIYKKKRFVKILDIINYISKDYHLLFVLHPSTKKRLKKYKKISPLLSNPNISLINRMGYIDFIKLLSKAKFVITDGGSNQEELSYLNIPTLVMRNATERPEGIGKTAVLNGFNQDIVDKFIAKINNTTNMSQFNSLDHPSKLISDYIISSIDSIDNDRT